MEIRGRSRLFPSRQAVLFLAAIAAPCVLLVILSLRMIGQERELAEKRVTDNRRRLAADVGQELLARLDRIRLDVLNGGAALRFVADRRQAIALVANAENDRLVLPWDQLPEAAAFAAAVRRLPFADAVANGERQELVGLEFDAAATSYRRALAEARLPSQTAFVQLLIARALQKGGRGSEGDALYRNVLRIPPHVIDEQGIPFALYAARRLLDSAGTESDRAAIFDAVRTVTDSSSPLAPAAVYMLKDVADELVSGAHTGTDRQSAQRLADGVASFARDVEQALAVRSLVPSLLSKGSAASRSDRESTWAAFGDPALWLVGTATSANRQTLVAVRGEPVFASLRTLRDAVSAGGDRPRIVANAAGEPLGDALPGLSVSFPPNDASVLVGAAGLQRSFYLTALALVLSMTLFGGYLFWRDVRREMRLAEMRSQFVSSVSHELKTPLTAIRMFAETLLMRRASAPDARDEYLATIVNESERLTRLLNNVLDFSKIEQGKKTYRLEQQPLGAIVRAAAKAMEYPLSQQGFELRVDIDESVPLVAADPDAIEQAILNLLSNAMKYSGDGRVISLQLAKKGDSAVISVTDRGLGVPHGEQARIFERFYRIAGPERDHIPGAGLGLTLVDHIARAHGGEVFVESAPGIGSTFSISLPLIHGEAPELAPEKALA